MTAEQRASIAARERYVAALRDLSPAIPPGIYNVYELYGLALLRRKALIAAIRKETV